MQTLYFLLMIVCVGALVVWAALPERGAAAPWWPFAMKEDVPAQPGATQAGDGGAPAGQGVLSWRERAARAAAQRPLAPDRSRRRAAAPAPGRRLS